MPGGVRDVVPFALTVACAGAFAFLSGGYILTRSAPLAIVYLLLAGLWLWFLRSSARPSRLYVSALGVFGLFVAWSGLSVLWSLGPDLTWVAFDLSAFYLVVAAVLGLTPARALQVRVVTVGFLVVVVAVGVYAYLGKVLPDVVTHAHTYARLDSPIGYWNVLALLMVMGLVVALALAGDGRIHPGWRTLAALAAVPLCFAFFFTLSRGGWVALAVALLVYFGLSSTRIASLASLIAVALPVAAVLWRVRHLTTLFQATLDDALRTQQGHVLLGYSLAALAVAAGAQLAIALVQNAVPWPRRLRVAAGAVIIVVLVLGVGGGSARYVQARGGSAWVHARLQAFASDSDQTSSAEGAGRLISLNTGRPPLWREALRQARVDPVAGSGAGTFPFTHYRFRTTGGVVRHAHSEWFNTLSELGVVGLALLVAALLLFVAAAVRNPFRRRSDRVQPLLVALQAGIVAFLVHISWDWDWGMAAVGTVFFLFIATCSAYLSTRAADDVGRAAPGDGEGPLEGASPEDAAPPARRPMRWPLRAAATAAIVLLAASWGLPYLATRAAGEALSAASAGRVQAALDDARRAAALDPLAVDPLLTEALVLQQQGRNQEALATLDRAARLQPANYEVYYQQGLLQLNVFARKRAAAAAFERALALNPLDAASRSELALALAP